jgi:hypothetical protein
MKKLQEEDKNDQENQERQLANKNELLVANRHFFATIDIAFIKQKIYFNNISSSQLPICGYEPKVFRPPCV